MVLNKSQVDASDLSTQQISEKLLACVKKGQLKEVSSLIENGADVNYGDEVGCTPLHYAALGGHVGLVVQIIEKGGNVKKVDVNGETPVHKAARKSHLDVIAALVAYGADINILNMLGQSALELAVINKDANTLTLLCRFGAEALLQDWTWTMEDMAALNRKDKSVLKILGQQTNRYTGYKYGGISFEVHHIKPSQDVNISSVGVTIVTETIQHDFYLYCCKKQPEYANIGGLLQQEERLFSDVIELDTWVRRPNILKLRMTVSGTLRCNERPSLLPVECSLDGRIDECKVFEDDEDNDTAKQTSIAVTITMPKKGCVKFAVITTEVPETFTVTDEAVCIQPVMEPEAKIEIPQGTFEGEGKLHINVSETKDYNTEEADLDEPLLITNVLDLTMSDGKQPKKALKMKIPKHTESESDIIILACHKEFPENEDDWKISETENRRGQRFVAFEVNHFSWYVAGSRKYTEKAAKVATQAVNKEMTVELFAMIKFESHKNFSVTVECILKKHGKKRRKQWKEKGFQTQEKEYFDCVVPVYQSFKITCSEGLQVKTTDSERVLEFNPNKKRNFITFHLFDVTNLPCGEITIEKIMELEDVPVKEAFVEEPTDKVKTECYCGIFFKSKKVELKKEMKQTIGPQYEFVTSLPIDAKLPEITVPEELLRETKLDPNDLECPIRLTVLRYASLKRLGDCLTDQECYRLGINLNIPIYILNDLQKQEDFRERLFDKWRPKRPYESLVENLKIALERIDKSELAEIVQQAYQDETEFRYTNDTEL